MGLYRGTAMREHADRRESPRHLPPLQITPYSPTPSHSQLPARFSFRPILETRKHAGRPETLTYRIALTPLLSRLDDQFHEILRSLRTDGDFVEFEPFSAVVYHQAAAGFDRSQGDSPGESFAFFQ